MRRYVVAVMFVALAVGASANLSAGLAAKQAVVGAAAKAVDDKVSGVLVRANNTLAATTATLQALNGAAIDALNLASKVALDKVNRTKAAAFGVAQLGVGFAQAAQSAVVGNLYDAADVFLKKPMVAAAANFTDDADGYCFPEFKSPDFALPHPACAEGYTITPIGKCVKKTYRKVDVCFTGPKCMTPFAEVGEPTCFDDKVTQVITGLMAMKKAGMALPASVAPALSEFGTASVKLPLALAKESVELHLGAAAKALGVGKAFLGADNAELISMGTKLMAFDWPTLPDFNKVYDTVSKAVKQVPASALEDAKKVAPSCIHKCCKQDVQLDTDFAVPTWGCPAGKNMDMVGFKCIASPMGFAKCPTGTTSCFLASWHRPLCAVKASNCKALELAAFAHKLQKRTCPAAA